ncbi:MAG: A24 family peptidase [Sulfitobacter sp.]|uniref:A24 family peptidase n=1 Tax=Sulfitobacter sp. TaxID=1903071 RepID=UPI0032971337
MLGLLVRIDLREKRLPDRYTLPLIVLGLSLNAYAGGTLPVGEIWGAIVGYVTFWALGSLFFRLRGQEGLGLGDAKLLAAAGRGWGLAPCQWSPCGCARVSHATWSGANWHGSTSSQRP